MSVMYKLYLAKFYSHAHNKLAIPSRPYSQAILAGRLILRVQKVGPAPIVYNMVIIEHTCMYMSYIADWIAKLVQILYCIKIDICIIRSMHR